ncbi:unnamed protein product [Protopolystoma xenopodis]|uniref:Uncharacterized protein n=1 Tax=Protopolystoma xenopodis TaxID=117903 RepID=A0A3S5B561_9PLAT|nr:unnamed protein product [Protopolystoma xenopodis]
MQVCLADLASVGRPLGKQPIGPQSAPFPSFPLPPSPQPELVNLRTGSSHPSQACCLWTAACQAADVAVLLAESALNRTTWSLPLKQASGDTNCATAFLFAHLHPFLVGLSFGIFCFLFPRLLPSPQTVTTADNEESSGKSRCQLVPQSVPDRPFHVLPPRRAGASLDAVTANNPIATATETGLGRSVSVGHSSPAERDLASAKLAKADILIQLVEVNAEYLKAVMRESMDKTHLQKVSSSVECLLDVSAVSGRSVGRSVGRATRHRLEPKRHLAEVAAFATSQRRPSNRFGQLTTRLPTTNERLDNSSLSRQSRNPTCLHTGTRECAGDS